LNHLHLRLALLASVAPFATTAAFAQEAPPTSTAPDAPPADDQASDAAEIESSGDIVVTARRRDERLMDVPVVVSTLSGETIARYNSNSLTAIGELTPTVIVGSYRANGGGTIAIRGISSPANQTGFEQAASVAIDGVQTSNGRIAQLGFFDIEQVEVLKGPQALFFGKNSPAGVISIRTAGPTRDFEAGIRTSYEFVADEATVDGFVSGPLTDTLGARLALRYRHMDGYLRNLAGPLTNPFYNPATGAPAAAALFPGTSNPRPGEEEILGRLTLAFEPTDNFSATLRVFGAHSTDPGAGVATQNIGPCTGPNPRVSGVPDPYGECVVDNLTTVGDLPSVVGSTFRGVANDGTSSGELNAIISSLSMEWGFGPLSLASLTGYNRIRYDTFSGLDQTTFSQLAQTEKLGAEEFSQELRLTSDFESSPVNFVLGAYYQRATLDSFSDTMLGLQNYNRVANRYTSFETVAAQSGRTYSVFGQLVWDITEELELAGGMRWTRETKTYDKQNVYGISVFNTAATTYPGSNQVGHLQGRFRDSNISPEVTLNWRPDRDHTIFAAYRTGFKSGGFGLSNPLQVSTRISGVDFESEEAEGFEVGARAIMADGRLNMSAALFAYNFSNLQVNTYDPAAIAYTINNAGELRQRGFEVEGNFRATSFLSLHGALAYVHNRFRDFTGQCYSYAFPAGTVRATAVPPPNCSFVNATALTLQQVYDGRPPARSPQWSGNFGAVVTVPMAGNEVRLTGDTYYSGSYYAADTLAPPTRQEGFWRLNASITYAHPDNRWSIGLAGRNLTNRYYLLYAADRTGGAGVPGSIGEQRGVVSRGREILAQASFRF
jgi:iron complex outermembrane receptor protein